MDRQGTAAPQTVSTIKRNKCGNALEIARTSRIHGIHDYTMFVGQSQQPSLVRPVHAYVIIMRIKDTTQSKSKQHADDCVVIAYIYKLN